MATTTQSTYSLRACKDGKVVKPPAEQPSSDTSDSDSDTRKYSDIAAARSSVLSSAPSEVGSKGDPDDNLKLKVSSEPALSVSPSVEIVEDKNPNPWQTVERKNRRRASLESLSKLRKAGKKVEFLPRRSPVVTAEQDTAIKAAESQLTEAEKEKS
jgi:hypothetical protein